MKKTAISVLVGAMIFLCAGHALAMSFDEFNTQAENFLDGKIKPDAMIKLCGEALTAAKDNKDYTAYVYAIRSNVYWQKNDLKKAKTDAKKSIETTPTDIGFLAMGEILSSEGKYAEAADSLDKALENKKYLQDQEFIKKTILNLRLEANAISPVALWKAFDANEVAADDLYKGKLIGLKGKISSITSSPMGYPEINFAVDGYGVYTVQCEFPKDAKAEVAKLKKGQAVFVSGVCRGMTMKSVFVKGCKLIE